MDTQSKIQFIKANLKEHEHLILKFLVKNFRRHPLDALIPVPIEELEYFWKRLARGNLTILAFSGNEIVGCLTGNILAYEDILKATGIPAPYDNCHENCNRIITFCNDMTECDLTPLGVTVKSSFYDCGALCVAPEVRKLKLGSRLLEESIHVARCEGAEYYTAHTVSNYAKKIFHSQGFQTVNMVTYSEYFANEPQVLSRIEPPHESAHYVIKKLN